MYIGESLITMSTLEVCPLSVIFGRSISSCEMLTTEVQGKISNHVPGHPSIIQKNLATAQADYCSAVRSQLLGASSFVS